ncbi:MAG: hypothetical protein N2Z59_06385 [Alteraurantiacibacter sp.]|nr:hypothetical protein [Alteraurantiacibacter sp.]
MSVMFDQRFFASKLGASALVSVAAMVAFNLFAVSQAAVQTPAPVFGQPGGNSLAVISVELA